MEKKGNADTVNDSEVGRPLPGSEIQFHPRILVSILEDGQINRQQD